MSYKSEKSLSCFIFWDTAVKIQTVCGQMQRPWSLKLFTLRIHGSRAGLAPCTGALPLWRVVPVPVAAPGPLKWSGFDSVAACFEQRLHCACCARCPEACSSHLPTSHHTLRLPGQPGKCQALADPWSGPCSVTGKCCSLRALCLPGLPQLLQVPPAGWVLCLGGPDALGGGWVCGIHRKLPQEHPWLWSCFAMYSAAPFPVGRMQLAVLSLFGQVCCSCRASHTSHHSHHHLSPKMQ